MRSSFLAHPRGARAAACGATALLAIALSGCASFSAQKDPAQVDPNVMPADYKASVMAFVQNNPYGLVGVRAAELAPPELKPFGTESRYVVCLRAAGTDWRKEKVFIYYNGTINQFIDATPETCGTAAYQGFPEITTLLNTLRGNKK